MLDDSVYFAKRALAELEQAQRAKTSEAAEVHRQLAKAYTERAIADASPRIERGS